MIELNHIYNENCLDTMSRMDDDSVDMVLTSPPYDDLRTYQNKSAFDFEPAANELFRVLKQGGVVVWVVNDATHNGTESLTSFKQALYFKEIGFRVHDTMIYAKNNYVPLTHNRYEQQFEYMFVLSKGRPKTFNPIMIPCKEAGKPRRIHRNTVYDFEDHSMRNYRYDERGTVKNTKLHTNIWYYSVGCDRAHTGHPAPFPEQLALDMVSSWSDKWDLVYDPFMGGGTTAVACKELDRNYIGSEINESYTKAARARLFGIVQI